MEEGIILLSFELFTRKILQFSNKLHLSVLLSHYIFASSKMKLVAAILFFVFAGTVFAPVAQSLCKDSQISLFIVDEEKSNTQIAENEDTKKEQCKTIFYQQILASTSDIGDAAFLNSADLPNSPYRDYSTPPPDFC